MDLKNKDKHMIKTKKKEIKKILVNEGFLLFPIV